MTETKYWDREKRGRKFRLFLAPVGLSSPCGPSLILFDVSDNEHPQRLDSYLALPNEKYADLERLADQKFEELIARSGE